RPGNLERQIGAFALRVTGNIPLEDLVYMLERSSMQTNLALDKAVATAEWLETQLGKPVPGMMMKAEASPPSVLRNKRSGGYPG
ncbi:hypothetical protein HGG71_15660, partial [Rhodobacteraceae bacterium R_SAG2]|nr:hypothetical protein [Rhodobacteraceae bacterium R_SAG2]